MQVFLFPLVNVTLFSGTTKPLNIFEPRYLQMIEDSISQKIPIAVGFVDDPNATPQVLPGEFPSFIRPLAGYGLPQIVERRNNGTMMIFLRGEGKIHLKSVLDLQRPYLVCDANIIPESEEVSTEGLALVKSMQQILKHWLKTHIPDVEQQNIFLRNMTGPLEILGAFTTYLVRDYDLQQTVFELPSLEEKIHFAHRLIQSGEVTQ